MKLLSHFVAMQDRLREFLHPEGCDQDTFTTNMIHMLDGPEQREAQAEASFDYIGEACLTLSNEFHGDKVTLAEFRKALLAFIAAGNELDKIKKALFYGRGDDIGGTRGVGVSNCDQALVMFNGFNEGGDVSDLIGPEKHLAETVIHGIVGKATESVEAVELLFKTIFGFDGFDPVNLREEIGDGFWYDAILLKALGSDFLTEMRRNIKKLRLRFPNNFTEYDADNRDLSAERRVLEDTSEDEGVPSMLKRIADIRAVTATASSPGNADVNDYMRGMANGLILAEAILDCKEPAYIKPADEK